MQKGAIPKLEELPLVGISSILISRSTYPGPEYALLRFQASFSSAFRRAFYVPYNAEHWIFFVTLPTSAR